MSAGLLGLGETQRKQLCIMTVERQDTISQNGSFGRAKGIFLPAEYEHATRGVVVCVGSCAALRKIGRSGSQKSAWLVGGQKTGGLGSDDRAIGLKRQSSSAVKAKKDQRPERLFLRLSRQQLASCRVGRQEGEAVRDRWQPHSHRKSSAAVRC